MESQQTRDEAAIDWWLRHFEDPAQ